MRKPALYRMRTTKAQISLRIRSLTNAFVVGCLDSRVHKLAKSKILRLKLAFVSEQAGSSLTWSHTPKTGFLVTWLNFSALKVHDSYFGLTPAAEAMALIHELSHFDLYSVSLGPPDDGRTFEATDDVINAAFQKGVTEVTV